jgi:phage repressor protein C with HTH and peptisase S24 domain
MADEKRLQPEVAEIFARLDALRLPQKDLAAALDLEPDKVSKARTGERQFKAAEALKARKWLDGHEQRRMLPDQPPTRTAEAGETVEIIRLDLSLPMGQGATVDDYIEEEPVVFDLGYIRAFSRTPPARLRIARGVGDSMMPTLLPGDAVWIDSTQRHLNQSDKVWAVSINGGAAIKRLRPLRDGKVLVISDNKTIGDYEVDAEEIMIGGRVVRFERDI